MRQMKWMKTLERRRGKKIKKIRAYIEGYCTRIHVPGGQVAWPAICLQLSFATTVNLLQVVADG